MSGVYEGLGGREQRRNSVTSGEQRRGSVVSGDLRRDNSGYRELRRSSVTCGEQRRDSAGYVELPRGSVISKEQRRSSVTSGEQQRGSVVSGEQRRSNVVPEEQQRGSAVSEEQCRSNPGSGHQHRGSLQQPGVAFPCPPALEVLLVQHWKDVQNGFFDSEELNRILEFQSEELRWTSKKCDEGLECSGGRRRQNSLPVHLYKIMVSGDATALKMLLKRGYVDVDVLFEVRRDELEWQAQDISTFGASGLWSLEYKRELTSPLCMAAAQGYTECLRYLLEHGARPNLTAGGKAALHEACENANTDCVELLLESGASPNLPTEDGLTPLHLCHSVQSLRCAKALVRYGAKVDQPSEEEGETPLHVAARHSCLHHAHLYLRYGAEVNRTSTSGETPLGVACAAAQDPELLPECLQLCRLLLAHGADPNLADEERRTPMHKAARNVQRSLLELLLEHGAEVNAIDYNGASPLSCALQSAAFKGEQQPHLVVQMLLNHGSVKVWPLALLKVLTACAPAPKTVEVLFNSYSQVPVTYKWMESIPEDIYQLHQPFYQSLFALECRPRCLQHLCRATVRRRYGKDCHLLIPRLPIPKLLQRYLLLEPEGFIY